MTLPREQQAILFYTVYNAAQGLYRGDSPDMQSLVAAGLMQEAGWKSFVPDAYFRITSKGRAAIKAKRTSFSASANVCCQRSRSCRW